MKSYLAIKKVVPDEVVVKVRPLPFSSTKLAYPNLTLRPYLAVLKAVLYEAIEKDRPLPFSSTKLEAKRT